MKPLRPAPAPALALALAIALSACSDAGGNASTTLVRDSAGIEIVENSAAQWGEGAVWQLSEAPALTIGVMEGDPNYQLYRVSDALRLDDGGIVIANNGSSEFRIYDQEGNFVISGGGEGDGPGELRYISSIHVMPGDSLMVSDLQLDRVSVYDLQGEFGRSFQLTSLSTNGSVRLEGRLDDGSLILAEGGRPGPGDVTEGLRRDSSLFVRFDPATGQRDTIGWLAGPEALVRVTRSANLMQVAMIGMPYLRGSHLATTGNRLYHGASNTYEIAMYGRDTTAGPDRLIRRDYTIEPIDDEYKSARLEEWRAGVETAPGEPPRPDPAEGMPFPETLPAYSGLLADSEGNLWVEAFRWPGDEQPRWDIFDPTGAWLGTVETPPDFRPTRIGADYILGVSRDEFDIEQVKLYELNKPGEAS